MLILSRAAANGIGYSGSLNLTLTEARDLGAALATEFYVIGDAQTLRRSSFKSPVYYESYCSIFLVSARTGQLLLWERPSFENNEATTAEARLSQYLSSDDLRRRLLEAVKLAHADERLKRTILSTAAEAVIEEAPEDEKAAEIQGIRLAAALSTITTRHIPTPPLEQKRKRRSMLWLMLELMVR